jgi:hypothetical protein
VTEIDRTRANLYEVIHTLCDDLKPLIFEIYTGKVFAVYPDP